MDALAAALSQAIKLHQAGELHAAEAAYRGMIQRNPQHADAWHLLGVLATQQGRLQAAIEHISQALQLAGDHPLLLYNLAHAQRECGQLEAAIESFQRAVKLAPQNAEAHLNLASLQHHRRRYDDAQWHYERALQIQPDSPTARNSLGDVCWLQGKQEEAAKHYRLALQSRPNHLLWKLRLEMFGPQVFSSNEEIDAYRVRLAERLPAFRDSRLTFDLDELATSGCKPPVSLAYQGRDDLELKRRFAAIFTNRLPVSQPTKKSGHCCIGFVVSEGSEGVFLRGMAGVLNHLTPGRFRPLVIAAPSAREKFRKAVTNREVGFLALPKPFTAAVEAIRQAACDLLYFWEIGVDCSSYYLPFFRLAPVQCTSWGWPVTSGIDGVDYFISSEHLEPPDAEAHYSEKLVRLKNLPNYYATPRLNLAAAERSRFGFREEDHLYFCGQNPRKIHPDFDRLVAGILRTDLHGVFALVEAPQPHVTTALRARFAATMPDCADRIRFVPRMRSGDYLDLMAAADVVLDTVHYGGGANSTYDAFAVAAPVVTLPTAFHRGRYAAAAYGIMGMSQCVAATDDQYVQIAVQLASDPVARREASLAIEATRGRLFDNVAAVRELEDFFETAIA